MCNWKTGKQWLTGVVVAFALEDEVGAVAEVSLVMLLFISAASGFRMGGCGMTIGWGAVFEVLIIGFICVDPTFIVGVADCCIVLAAVFNIFAIKKKKKTFNQIWISIESHKNSLTILLYDVCTIFRNRLSNLNCSRSWTRNRYTCRANLWMCTPKRHRKLEIFQKKKKKSLKIKWKWNGWCDSLALHPVQKHFG